MIFEMACLPCLTFEMACLHCEGKGKRFFDPLGTSLYSEQDQGRSSSMKSLS